MRERNVWIRRFHRLLVRAFAARQTADYDTDFDLGRSEVRELIEEGGNFLEAARNHIEGKSADDERESGGG